MSGHLTNAELFRRLVAFDSTSANSNLPMADFICDYLNREGVEIIRNSSPDQDKTNVVVWMGPGEPGMEGLVLAGHMDTVPAREPGWESDPFDLTERDGSYFGRGASDMKGFLAIAMNIVRSVGTSRLRRPLVLLFTYDEEAGTLGAHQLVRTWPRDRALPRNVIIGEPTSLRVVTAHKGHLKLRIVIQGKSAHSGYPQLGRNAIEHAGAVINALAKMRLRLEAERPQHGDRFPVTPYPTLNIGTIHGGAAVNIVPERCELEVGIRLLPEMQSAEIIESVRDTLARVVAPGEWQLDVLSDSPPMLLPQEARICRELCELVGQRSLESVSFASDAGWLQQLGLECVLFGPGSIEVAHRANEFIPRDEFERAAELFPVIIDRFCMR